MREYTHTFGGYQFRARIGAIVVGGFLGREYSAMPYSFHEGIVDTIAEALADFLFFFRACQLHAALNDW